MSIYERMPCAGSPWLFYTAVLFIYTVFSYTFFIRALGPQLNKAKRWETTITRIAENRSQGLDDDDLYRQFDSSMIYTFYYHGFRN